MHDITFRDCTFKYQPRMSFECIWSGAQPVLASGVHGGTYRINCTSIRLRQFARQAQ